MTNYLIEKGTNYSYLLTILKNPSFERIQGISKKFTDELPSEVRSELWEDLNHGEDKLKNEALLSMYMSAYGKMHIAKLLAAFEYLHGDNLTDIHIIDWGCGQAMATLAYYEYLRNKQITPTIKSITLVEPSELALKRAALHVQKLFPTAEIRTVLKDFNSLSIEDIQIEENQTVLHFFSNVLDMECFSIEQLAKLIKKNKTHNFMVCVSPFINEYKNQRLYNFINCFLNANTLADYINQEWINGWTVDYKVVEVNLSEITVYANTDTNYPETVTDIDGNVYKTVKIGNQIWMTENLRVSRYRNGDKIPNVENNEDWCDLETGAWCNYDNDSEYDAKYGKLYNWYAVDDKRELAPEGWHIPSDDEWNIIVNELGGYGIAGNKLKEAGSKHWKFTDEFASNESHYNALPNGYRSKMGKFIGLFSEGIWWATTILHNDTPATRGLSGYSSGVSYHAGTKQSGKSVRCLKNTVIETQENIYLEDILNTCEIVWKNGLCGFRSSKGEMITPYKYDDVSPFNNVGISRVSINGKHGILNKSGKEIVPLKYDFVLAFCEGLLLVKLDNKWGYVNTDGIEVIPLKYNDAFSFYEGLANVKLKDKWGYIDKNGNEVIPFIYDEALCFIDGFAVVKRKNQWLFIDKIGDVLVELDVLYDTIGFFKDGLAPVKMNDKWGFVDKTGLQIIPTIYVGDGPFGEILGPKFSNGLAKVKLDDKMGYIDINGYWIIDSDETTVLIKTRSMEEFKKEIDVQKLGAYRNEKGYLYVAHHNKPSSFVAHISKSINCKADVNNPVITTFQLSNGEEYNVLHNLNRSNKI